MRRARINIKPNLAKPKTDLVCSAREREAVSSASAADLTSRHTRDSADGCVTTPVLSSALEIDVTVEHPSQKHSTGRLPTSPRKVAFYPAQNTERERRHSPSLLSPRSGRRSRLNSLSSVCEPSSPVRHKPRKFTGEEDLDTKSMRMVDLIAWNPKKERKLERKVIEEALVQENLPKSEKKGIQPMAPQVTIGADGQIVLDEASLIIRDTQQAEMWETVDEDRLARHTTSMSFRQRHWRKGTVWSAKETDLFYEILRCTGPDFGLMHEFFPTRARNELKSKYNREEKFNWERLKMALAMPAMLDSSLYDKAQEMIDEIKVEEEEKRNKKKKKMDSNANTASIDWDESTADLIGEAEQIIMELEGDNRFEEEEEDEIPRKKRRKVSNAAKKLLRETEKLVENVQCNPDSDKKNVVTITATNTADKKSVPTLEGYPSGPSTAPVESFSPVLHRPKKMNTKLVRRVETSVRVANSASVRSSKSFQPVLPKKSRNDFVNRDAGSPVNVECQRSGSGERAQAAINEKGVQKEISDFSGEQAESATVGTERPPTPPNDPSIKRPIPIRPLTISSNASPSGIPSPLPPISSMLSPLGPTSDVLWPAASSSSLPSPCTPVSTNDTLEEHPPSTQSIGSDEGPSAFGAPAINPKLPIIPVAAIQDVTIPPPAPSPLVAPSVPGGKPLEGSREKRRPQIASKAPLKSPPKSGQKNKDNREVEAPKDVTDEVQNQSCSERTKEREKLGTTEPPPPKKGCRTAAVIGSSTSESEDSINMGSMELTLPKKKAVAEKSPLPLKASSAEKSWTKRFSVPSTSQTYSTLTVGPPATTLPAPPQPTAVSSALPDDATISKIPTTAPHASMSVDPEKEHEVVATKDVVDADSHILSKDLVKEEIVSPSKVVMQPSSSRPVPSGGRVTRASAPVPAPVPPALPPLSRGSARIRRPQPKSKPPKLTTPQVEQPLSEPGKQNAEGGSQTKDALDTGFAVPAPPQSAQIGVRGEAPAKEIVKESSVPLPPPSLRPEDARPPPLEHPETGNVKDRGVGCGSVPSSQPLPSKATAETVAAQPKPQRMSVAHRGKYSIRPEAKQSLGNATVRRPGQKRPSASSSALCSTPSLPPPIPSSPAAALKTIIVDSDEEDDLHEDSPLSVNAVVPQPSCEIPPVASTPIAAAPDDVPLRRPTRGGRRR